MRYQKLKKLPKKRQNRIQALYLIVTQQAKSRSQVSRILGSNRNTISQWFSLYEDQGLEKMLEIHKSKGARTKISEAALDEIKEILGSEKGFRTYKEIHQLVVRKHKFAVGYSAVHNMVRYRLKAKAKSPRPCNPKKTKPPSKNFRKPLEPDLKN